MVAPGLEEDSGWRIDLELIADEAVGFLSQISSWTLTVTFARSGLVCRDSGGEIVDGEPGFLLVHE